MSARTGAPDRAHGRRRRERSLAERLLASLGADPAFVEDLLGDLAEERAERAAREGRVRAGAWFAIEAARAVPHLAWNALRHGSPQARLRLAAVCGAFALAATGAASLWAKLPGPPARLYVGDRNGLVINNVKPVQLRARVLDASGRALDDGRVEYRHVAGAPVELSRDGVLRCGGEGTALLRASLGDVGANVVVRCAPVASIHMPWNTGVFVDDSASPLPIDVRDSSGNAVALLAGSIRVSDSTVAAVLRDGRVQPLRAGRTAVDVTIGDEESRLMLVVFERVPTLVGLRPGQRWVVAPLELAPREAVRWPLPIGELTLSFGPGSGGRAAPPTSGFSRWGRGQVPLLGFVDGPVMCMPDLATAPVSTHCLVRGPGATVVLAHPGTFPEPVRAQVALDVFRVPETAPPGPR